MVPVSFRVPPDVLHDWQVNEPDFRKRLQAWMIRHRPKTIGEQIAERDKERELAAAAAALDEVID
jgi:hypothetical protein